MSAVRMCDRCGVIFSERTEGWASMQAQKIKKVEGRRQVITEDLDACPSCADGIDAPEPRMPVSGPKAGSGHAVESGEVPYDRSALSSKGEAPTGMDGLYGMYGTTLT